MKPLQSRVVAAWITALPIAYGLVVQQRREITRFRTEPQAEIARKLHAANSISFVSFFFVTFVMLVLVYFAIDWLAILIRRLFPERDVAAKSIEPTNPVA